VLRPANEIGRNAMHRAQHPANEGASRAVVAAELPHAGMAMGQAQDGWHMTCADGAAACYHMRVVHTRILARTPSMYVLDVSTMCMAA
jgi:Xaa-Pro aminopeptidase